MERTQIIIALMRARGKVESRLRELQDLRVQAWPMIDFTTTEAALRSSMQRIDDRLRRLYGPQTAPLRSQEDGKIPRTNS